MSKAKRVDKNQKEIVDQLRQLGFTVEYTYMIGHGFPDFIIGFKDLHNILVELKSDKGKLTDDEKDLHNRYKGYIITAYSLEDILLGIQEYYERIIHEFRTLETSKTE